jgi:hypothetical protein
LKISSSRSVRAGGVVKMSASAAGAGAEGPLRWSFSTRVRKAGSATARRLRGVFAGRRGAPADLLDRMFDADRPPEEVHVPAAQPGEIPARSPVKAAVRTNGGLGLSGEVGRRRRSLADPLDPVAVAEDRALRNERGRRAEHLDVDESNLSPGEAAFAAAGGEHPPRRHDGRDGDDHYASGSTGSTGGRLTGVSTAAGSSFRPEQAARPRRHGAWPRLCS